MKCYIVDRFLGNELLRVHEDPTYKNHKDQMYGCLRMIVGINEGVFKVDRVMVTPFYDMIGNDIVEGALVSSDKGPFAIIAEGVIMKDAGYIYYIDTQRVVRIVEGVT